MRAYLIVLFALFLLNATMAEDRNHKKRQIYREEVLPHAGGKIPDTAFETDRLFLNRLQTEGVAVPDGIVTEQRNPQVHQYYNKSPRAVYRIALSSDARYTPPEGRYHHHEVPSVETTYLYPQIHGQKIELVPPTPAYPVYRQFQLHNSRLNQIQLQPKKKTQRLNLSPSTNRDLSKSYKTQSYQNFNIINAPLSASVSAVGPSPIKGPSKYYLPDFDASSNLFNEFDELFNNFNLHETEGNKYEKPVLRQQNF